ncbi:MAG TPA: amidase family protein [Alphaproteobacteria bacterium]|jgi:aspartyl-tRNA(Asn)/glutamyl-tRNA(Gln) amidotransferase subunit A|nr:amidase family protein [Alphaproteobacteria bacterium]MDP6269487.1 amidase family protein [Alphaproteobacteria bacterium]MDP7427099.1 amidase family protein [Alphaproteobacteria bacterium]HJM48705.1 amidase family protein [Alphaproteobacteria bacterium]
MNDLHYRSATELCAAIRAKQLSPVELMAAVLERLEESQSSLNAFITVTAETAQAAAARAEQALMEGAQLGPLHGLPFAVKDLTYTEGVRTTMGSYLFDDFIPSEDAVPVARLKAAGAILIGKTTTPEFGHKALTDAPLFGRTANPWDLSRTSGGSSGGSAAAVAAGIAPLALGTDGGGSVRIPAACCGIVGLKPTLGRVPHIHAPDAFGNNSYIGPMCRSVADTCLAFDIISGPDRRDPYALNVAPEIPRLESASGLRLAWLAQAGPALDPEVAGLGRESIDMLAAMGAQVSEIEEDFAALEADYLTLMRGSFAGRLGHHLPEDEQTESRLDRSLVNLIRQGQALSASDLVAAQNRRSEFFRHIQERFTDFDFILSPTLSAPALAVDQDPLGGLSIAGQAVAPGSIRAGWYPYTFPFNLSGHPAISIPCGFTATGLPVGLQIVGPWQADRQVLELAAMIETARPWSHHRPGNAIP